LLGEVMAPKGAQKRLFRPRPPARQAVRVGVFDAGTLAAWAISRTLWRAAGPPAAAFRRIPSANILLRCAPTEEIEPRPERLGCIRLAPLYSVYAY